MTFLFYFLGNYFQFLSHLYKLMKSVPIIPARLNSTHRDVSSSSTAACNWKHNGEISSRRLIKYAISQCHSCESDDSIRLSILCHLSHDKQSHCHCPSGQYTYMQGSGHMYEIKSFHAKKRRRNFCQILTRSEMKPTLSGKSSIFGNVSELTLCSQSASNE